MNKSSEQEAEVNNENIIGASNLKPSTEVTHRAEDDSGEAHLNLGKQQLGTQQPIDSQQSTSFLSATQTPVNSSTQATNIEQLRENLRQKQRDLHVLMEKTANIQNEYSGRQTETLYGNRFGLGQNTDASGPRSRYSSNVGDFKIANALKEQRGGGGTFSVYGQRKSDLSKEKSAQPDSVRSKDSRSRECVDRQKDECDEAVEQQSVSPNLSRLNNLTENNQAKNLKNVENSFDLVGKKQGKCTKFSTPDTNPNNWDDPEQESYANGQIGGDRDASAIPSQLQYESNQNVEYMTHIQNKFEKNSANFNEEIKSKAPNHHNQSVVEQSQNYLIAETAQRIENNKINLQIDRLQILHGVLESENDAPSQKSQSQRSIDRHGTLFANNLVQNQKLGDSRKAGSTEDLLCTDPPPPRNIHEQPLIHGQEYQEYRIDEAQEISQKNPQSLSQIISARRSQMNLDDHLGKKMDQPYRSRIEILRSSMDESKTQEQNDDRKDQDFLRNQRERCNDSALSYNLQLNTKTLSSLLPAQSISAGKDLGAVGQGLMSSAKNEGHQTFKATDFGIRQNATRSSMAQMRQSGSGSYFTGLHQGVLLNNKANNHYENNAYANQVSHHQSTNHFPSSKQNLHKNSTPVQNSYQTYSNMPCNNGYLSCKSNAVEIQDNLSNQGCNVYQNQIDKNESKAENDFITLTPNNHYNNQNNFPSNISQMSGFGNRKSSISPTRSVIGLVSVNQLNNNKIDLALQERCNKSMEELHRVKTEYRAKEQEYEKKIAVQQQQIELLQMQVKETEQREAQQRSMYEKMFNALENPNGLDSALQMANLNGGGQKRPEEMFNSTQLSFGKEIGQMQKQFQDEMQARIQELESLVKSKEQELIQEKAEKESRLSELQKNLQKADGENQDKGMKIISLKRQLENKEQELMMAKDEVSSSQQEIELLRENHRVELLNIEKDTQMKYEELKQLYQRSKSTDDKQNDAPNQTIADLNPHLQRISNLEKQLHALSGDLQLKELTIKSAEKSMLGFKDQMQGIQQDREEQAKKYESKIRSKKDKIRGLQTEYSEKNRLCEHLKMKIEDLEKNVKFFQDQKLQSNQTESKGASQDVQSAQSIDKRLENHHTMTFFSFQRNPLRIQPCVMGVTIKKQGLLGLKMNEHTTYADDLQRSSPQALRANVIGKESNPQITEMPAYERICENCAKSGLCRQYQTNPIHSVDQTIQLTQQITQASNQRADDALQDQRGRGRQHQSLDGEQAAHNNIGSRAHSASASQGRRQLNQSNMLANNLSTFTEKQRLETIELQNHKQNNGIINPQQNQTLQPKPHMRQIAIEDFQLFNRLKKMIDATIKMECAGCHKLIPTTQFYDHLIESLETEEGDDHAQLVDDHCSQEEYIGLLASENHQENNGKIDPKSQNQSRETLADLNGSKSLLNNNDLSCAQENNCISIENQQKDRGAALQNSSLLDQSTKWYQNNRPSVASSDHHNARVRSVPAVNSRQNRQEGAHQMDGESCQWFLGNGTQKYNELQEMWMDCQNQSLLDENQIQIFKQKYCDALTIVKQYQNQLKAQNQRISEMQEVLRTQEGALQAYMHNQQNLVAKGLQDEGLLRQLEEREQAVQSLISQNLQLHDDKQKIQLQLDRLKLQLEQKKTQLALLEERKAENELELKKEKKFLLESFLRAREENKKLVDLQQFHSSQEIYDPGDQYKENFNIDNQGFINNESNIDLENMHNYHNLNHEFVDNDQQIQEQPDNDMEDANNEEYNLLNFDDNYPQSKNQVIQFDEAQNQSQPLDPNASSHFGTFQHFGTQSQNSVGQNLCNINNMQNMQTMQNLQNMLLLNQTNYLNNQLQGFNNNLNIPQAVMKQTQMVNYDRIEENGSKQECGDDFRTAPRRTSGVGNGGSKGATSRQGQQRLHNTKSVNRNDMAHQLTSSNTVDNKHGKIKLKIMDSRTSGTRVTNSQYPSASNLSAQSRGPGNIAGLPADQKMQHNGQSSGQISNRVNHWSNQGAEADGRNGKSNSIENRRRLAQAKTNQTHMLQNSGKNTYQNECRADAPGEARRAYQIYR